MRILPVLLASSIVLLSACGSQDAPATPPTDPEATTPPVAASPDAAPSPRPATPAPPSPSPVPADSPPFAAAPAVGWVARANCHMGACTWNRYDVVQREGDDAGPRYRLQLTQGESKHAGDYPTTPDGVDIAWDAAGKPAEVQCSRTAPKASIDAYSGTLSLNPRGVPGAMQALANLYFATCHGEYGNDAELAGKYGYDVG